MEYLDEKQIDSDQPVTTACCSVEFDWNKLTPTFPIVEDPLDLKMIHVDKNNLFSLILVSNDIGFIHEGDKEYLVVLSPVLSEQLKKLPKEKQQELVTFISEMEHQWSITRAKSEAIPMAMHDTIWDCLQNGCKPKLSIHASNQQMWDNPLSREDF